MTKRFVLIGHPVNHSISPAIHAEAYRLLGANAEYCLADCPDVEAVRARVDAIRSGQIDGANVTVPWKQLAYDLADEVHQTALDVGVANVLARDQQGRITAYNTDASALGTELRAAVLLSGVQTSDRPGALVLGNGGAAFAAVVGCRLAGIEEVIVTARRYTAERAESDWPNAERMRALGARTVAWWGSPELASILDRVHLVVQATSAGMKGGGGGEDLAALIPWKKMKPTVAYDLVYVPRITPFLRDADRAGHFIRGGLGMLVGQARDAIEIWMGNAPSIDELLPVAEGALAS